MSPPLIMMQPILLTFSFTSITDVTVGSTFLVNDDGTDVDNNIDAIRLILSSPSITTLLYNFDVTDNTNTVLTVTPRFLVHARIQVTFQVQTQVGVQGPYQVHFQVSPKMLFQAVNFIDSGTTTSSFVFFLDKSLLTPVRQTTIPSILSYCRFRSRQQHHRCTILTSPTTVIQFLTTHQVLYITDTFSRYARCCSKKCS